MRPQIVSLLRTHSPSSHSSAIRGCAARWQRRGVNVLSLLGGGGGGVSDAFPAASATTANAAAPRGRRRRSRPVNSSSSGDDGGPSSSSTQGVFSGFFSKEAVGLALVLFVVSALVDLVINQKANITQKLKDRFMLTLQVRSSQAEFAMIMDWMSRQPHGRLAHNVSIKPVTVLDEEESEDGRTSREATGSTLVPGYGSHYFPFRGTVMWIVREEDAAKQHGGGRISTVDREHEKLTISFLSRDRAVVEDFLAEVRESWMAHVKNKVSIYIGSPYRADGWALLSERERRPLSTLYLPPHVKAVVQEVRQFLCMREVYTKLGIPWRRGYLLEGPPGTGKTSFVMAMASELNLPVHLLSLQSQKLDDEALLTMVSGVPRRAILLIEDFENAITQSDDSGSIGGGGDARVSMSALLNALDGLSSSEGRILVITTNDVSKIPSPQALLRPGRIDKRVHFAPLKGAGQEEMRASFLRAFEEVRGKDEAGRAPLPPQEEGTTPAEFQSQCLDMLYAATSSAAPSSQE